MIFGLRNEELKRWRRHFALLPRLLNDGRVVWLQSYWGRWRVNLAGMSWFEVSLEPYDDRAPDGPPPRGGSSGSRSA